MKFSITPLPTPKYLCDLEPTKCATMCHVMYSARDKYYDLEPGYYIMHATHPEFMNPDLLRVTNE